MVGLLRLPSPSKGHMMLTDSINALVFEGANHGALGQNLSSMPNAHGALGQNLSSMANAHGALGQSQRFHENAPPVTPPRLLKKNVDHFFFTQTFFLRKISNFLFSLPKNLNLGSLDSEYFSVHEDIIFLIFCLIIFRFLRMRKNETFFLRIFLTFLFSCAKNLKFIFWDSELFTDHENIIFIFFGILFPDFEKCVKKMFEHFFTHF